MTRSIVGACCWMALALALGCQRGAGSTGPDEDAAREDAAVVDASTAGPAGGCELGSLQTNLPEDVHFIDPTSAAVDPITDRCTRIIRVSSYAGATPAIPTRSDSGSRPTLTSGSPMTARSS